jgi:site-specific recombinase XerD
MARFLIPTIRGDAMKLTELATKCCDHLVHSIGYSKETRSPYLTAVNQFVAFLRSRNVPDDIRSFTDEHVAAFHEYLGAMRAHPNTISQKLSALRAVAKYGMKQKRDGKRLISEDPTAALEWPVRRKSNVVIPTPRELAAYLAVPITRRQQIARDLLLDTGLRSSELCRAKIRDLRESPDGVYLAVTVKGRGAQDQQRDTPVSGDTALLIHEERILKDLAGDDDPIMVRDDGTAHDKFSLNVFVKSIARRAGLSRKLSPHKFRHLANAMQKMGGVDPHTRGRALNHSNPSSLQAYDHLLPGELHRARLAQRQAMDRYLGRSSAVQEPARPSQELVDRVATRLAALPADKLETVLGLLQSLTGEVQCGPEPADATRNAGAEIVNADAELQKNGS